MNVNDVLATHTLWTGTVIDINAWVEIPVAVVWSDGIVQTVPPCDRVIGKDNDFTLYWTVPPTRTGTIVAIVIGDTVSLQRIEAWSNQIHIQQRVKVDA